MLKRTSLALLGLLLAATAACDDDDEGTGLNGPETFTATLTGTGEVPPVPTNASGTADFTVNGATTDLEVTVSDIENAVAAHIHSGAAGVNGAVLVPLFSAGNTPFTGSGTLVSGSFDAGDVVGDSVSYDALVARLGDESLYVNVHTAANPDGEIRGQIADAP